MMHSDRLPGAVGMMVDRHGNQLSLNGEDVYIQEACNGMRMIITLILVSYVFAFATPLRGYVRLLVTGILSPLTAIACNVIRLVPTVWMFGRAAKDPALLDAAYRFHNTCGWVMLVVAFLLLMGVVRLLRWALVPVATFTCWQPPGWVRGASLTGKDDGWIRSWRCSARWRCWRVWPWRNPRTCRPTMQTPITVVFC